MTTIHGASFAELPARVLYDLLRLRVDVFVVEQNCPYPELDGRDVESGTRHVWAADSVGPTAYLRVLDDGAGTRRIGRVCTRLDARGYGLATRLMEVALEMVSPPVVLDAQSQLARWYEQFGFEVDGPEFVEDGIPHLPMRRA